jgi:hypothetical protein
LPAAAALLSSAAGAAELRAAAAGGGGSEEDDVDAEAPPSRLATAAPTELIEGSIMVAI